MTTERVKKMDRPPKVWVSNAAGHDHSAALQYGELVPITQDRVNVFNVQRLTSEMHETMADYQPKDWLLLSGHIVINCIALNIVLEKHGFAQFLIYDAKTHQYVPRDINQTQIQNKTMEAFV